MATMHTNALETLHCIATLTTLSVGPRPSDHKTREL